REPRHSLTWELPDHADYKTSVFYRYRQRPDRGDHHRAVGREGFGRQIFPDNAPHRAILVVTAVPNSSPLVVVLDKGVALVEQQCRLAQFNYPKYEGGRCIIGKKSFSDVGADAL